MTGPMILSWGWSVEECGGTIILSQQEAACSSNFKGFCACNVHLYLHNIYTEINALLEWSNQKVYFATNWLEV